MRKSSVGGVQPLRIRAEDRQSLAAGRLSSGMAKHPARRSGIPMAKKNVTALIPPGASAIPRKRQSSSTGSNYFGGNRMSNAEMSKKDTRPIHEKSFQQKCATNLIKFLEAQRYIHPVNLRMLMSPQTKDFTRIFEFLMKFLDPAYTLPNKMEEEIPRTVKSLCYPYAITKSQLLNIGARHSWPFLLAALDWLRQLIEMTPDYECEEGMEVFESTDVEEKVTVDFCIKAYRKFMAGNDDWLELENDMEERLVGNAVRAANMLVEPYNKVQAEFDLLKSASDKLDHLKVELHNLNIDSSKFNAYKRDVEAHIEQKVKANTTLESQQKVLHEELAAFLEDSRQKKVICLSQPMNLQEAVELKRIRNSIEEQCNSVEGSINEVKKQIWEEETCICNKREKVVAEEKLYNNKAQANQFIPASAQNAQGHNFEVNLAFKSNSEDLSKIEFLLAKALKQLKESNRTKNLDLVKEDDCGEKLCELIKDINEEINDLKETIRNLEEDLSYRKEDSSKEVNKFQEEIKRLESDFRDKRSLGDLDIEQARQAISNLQQELVKVTSARNQEPTRLFHDLNETAKVVAEYKIKFDNEILIPLGRLNRPDLFLT